jgi:energy-coupling factor transport system permease protein
VKPLPAALLAAAPLIAAIVAWNPLWLGAATAAAALLLLAAPPPRGLYAATALASGLVVFVLNPFVSVQGLTVLWQGPHIPVLDTQVTTEELAFGAGAGMRVAASALAVAAFVRLADADLLLRAVGRVAPRSAMIAALATRMVPALERDAAGIVVAARTRGARMRSPRTAAGLLGPLLATSLERSLSVAEAMEARGYGGPGRTRVSERSASRRELGAGLVGAAALAVVAAGLATGATAFQYYDTLGDPLSGGATAGAAALVLLGAAGAGVVRWGR